MEPVIVKKLSIIPNTIEIFENIARLPYSFFLDSSLFSKKWGRYSYAGFDPSVVIKAKGDSVEVFTSSEVITEKNNPLEVLRKYLRKWSIDETQPVLPFTGGAVGYLSYDLGRQIERIPELSRDDIYWPDLEFGFYDTVLVVDHLTDEAFICASGFPETDHGKRLQKAQEGIEDFCRLVEKNATPSLNKSHQQTSTSIERSFTKEAYCEAVVRVKEHIKDGDVYVLNLSQRFAIETEMDVWNLYKRLRKASPTCFSAFLNFGKRKILSGSPECFLKVQKRRVLTRPIKGTRPRGSTEEMDRELESELRSNEKERAELAMIVDLERNDLSRVCEPGSVRVTDLYNVEKYSTVFQMTATVEGEMKDDADVVDLLKATFPGGSVTGAPKVSAMKIIESLEPVRRGLYTGSLGFIGFNGNAEFNIVIRTILLNRGKAYLNVGGGVTIDSDPEKEYIETLDKAKAMFMALGIKSELDDRF